MKFDFETLIFFYLKAELKPDVAGCNELRFNLTADNINAIFQMYPGGKSSF